MSYLNIANFKYGLDTRRSELTSQPGTLLQLNNAHVNQGGEIEKRKAFVRTVIDPNQSTFGMEITSNDTILVFGSGTTPVGFPFIVGGVTIDYQRLPYPSPGGPTMLGILGSTSFAGKAWAIADFGFGGVLGYYDGVLVADFTSGLSFGALTNAAIAALLTVLINATPGYLAIQQPNPNDNKINIFGGTGSAYSVAITVNSTTGTLTDQNDNAGIPAVPATVAIGSFAVTNGSASAGVNKITHVKVNGVDLLSGSVDWVTSNVATAAAIAANINAFTSSPDYTAEAVGSVVQIFAVTAGSTPNGFVVQVTAAGNLVVGQCTLTLVFTTGTTVDITHILVNGVDILTGTAAFSGTLAGTVALAVTDINTNNATYNAFSSSNNIYISQRVTASNDIPLNVTGVTSAGGGFMDGTTPPLVVTGTPNSLTSSFTADHPPSWVTIGSALASVTGGLPPYKHNWRTVDPNDHNAFAISPNNYTTSFQTVGSAGQSTATVFVDEVTDAAGNTAISNTITIYGQNLL